MEQRVNEVKIQKAIIKLILAVRNPPRGNKEELRQWIKEKASQVKHYLQILLNENIENKYEMLDQLSQIRQQLSEMNIKRKKPKRSVSRNSKTKSLSKGSVKQKENAHLTPQFQNPFSQTLNRKFKASSPEISRNYSQTKSNKSITKSNKSLPKKLKSQKSSSKSKSKIKRVPSIPISNSSLDQKSFTQSMKSSSQRDSLYASIPNTNSAERSLIPNIENFSKQRLLREYRLLLQRNQSLKTVIKEYHDQNEELNQTVKDQKKNIEELYNHYKDQKRVSKKLKKQLNEEQENESLAMENAMLREQVEEQKVRIQQAEEERESSERLMQTKLSDKDNLQHRYYQCTKDIEELKSMLELQREENLKLKLNAEKEFLIEKELKINLQEKNQENQNQFEAYQLEINRLKQSLNGAHLKITQQESQISEMIMKLNSEQESNREDKEKVNRLEEELRIKILRIENREKEIIDFKQKDQENKKKIFELENSAQTKRDYSPQRYEKSINSQKELQTERQLHSQTRLVVQELEEKLEEANKQIYEQEKTMGELRRENEKLRSGRERWESWETEQNRAKERWMKESEEQRRKEVSGLEHGMREQEKEIASLKRCIEDQNEQVRRYEKVLRDQQMLEEELREELRRKIEQVVGVDQKNLEAAEEVRQLRKERVELGEQVRRWQQKHAEAQEELESLGAMREKQRNKSRRVEEKENEWSRTNSVEKRGNEKKQQVMSDLHEMIKDHKKQLSTKRL